MSFLLERASAELKRCFWRDGFAVAPRFLSPDGVRAVAARFAPLFAGEFETGIQPDEWNWRPGRDGNAITRQICNGWKADRTIAKIVLDEVVGRICAELMDWPGARINQDNVLWKPVGARALGFHQDDSYQRWIVPPSMVSCWIALDKTARDGGTIEYVRGSHRWAVDPPIAQFHDPADPLAQVRMAARAAGVELDIVPVEVPSGSAVFHHGSVWHGSRINLGNSDRRSLVAHCMSSSAEFHPVHTSPIYSRYRHHGTLAMDESFFPPLWRKDGWRSPFIEGYLQ